MKVKDLKKLLNNYKDDYIVSIKNNVIHITDYPEDLKVENGYYLELYINSAGGVWEGGTGNAPDGTYCGECSHFDCDKCGWKEER